MDYEKIIAHLKGINKKLEEMLKTDYKSSTDEFIKTRALIEMSIRRIYPDYEKVTKQMIGNGDRYWDLDSTSPKNAQEWFLDDVKRLKNSVETIIQEYEIYGFDDFKPIKEKTETTTKIGLPRVFSHEVKKIK